MPVIGDRDSLICKEEGQEHADDDVVGVDCPEDGGEDERDEAGKHDELR